MSTLSPLVEYLLAYEREDGGRICWLGASTAIIWLPGNFTATFDTYPGGTNFADILFYYRESPSDVPEALQQDSWGEGLQLSLGPITTVMMDAEAGSWHVIRQDSPTHTTLLNRTNLMQREDYAQQMLVIANEPDYKFVMALIRDWCTNYRIAIELEKQTVTLQALASAQGVTVPIPRAPIRGGI